LKKVIVSVINDLATDQRVSKVCNFLHKQGFEVLLVGRKTKNSMALDKREYKMHRMKLIWEKGPLFYAEFNVRLFFFLLMHKTNLLLSNDLDTLLPNFLVHKIKRVPIVYDSHELFTQTPEVIHRKFVQRTWQTIERCIVPRLKDSYTVNESIARIFNFQYKCNFQIVRNIPEYRPLAKPKTRKELGLPENKKIILVQGSGINIHRGSEELVESMQFLNDEYLLLFIGGGDVIHILKNNVKEKKLDSKVRFLPRIPYSELQHFTAQADLGVTIDKDTNPNYRYSLPNKIFDYMHAGIPVMASRLFEIEKIITHYKIGDFIPDHKPENIANTVRSMLDNKEKLREWKENLKFASEELNWQNEEKILKRVYKDHV
jgi:glycosyltransferase involved in cell wall biosynthesis